MSAYLSKILERIIENTNTTTHKGIIVASPSTIPPYKYHWIRDSALVMRVFIDKYQKTNDSKYFEYIMNYIENETKVQDLKTKSGLGEPKINIDCTPFDGEWGRPQNDGPALRGIMMLKIIKSFKYNYDVIINKLIVPIVLKDLDYVLENYDKVCFDIWEEKIGWHFYTRIVQLKFLKDIITELKTFQFSENKINRIKTVEQELRTSINDHIGKNDKGNYIISSFDKEGNIIKYEDSADILAITHIDFDDEIIDIFGLESILQTSNNLLDYFRSKYNDNELNLIGRYKEDKYYNGHIWIICSLAMAQVYLEIYKRRNKTIKRSSMDRAKSNPNNDLYIISNEILERILSLDVDFILPEQFDPKTSEYHSARKLTWNYSELYCLIEKLN